MIRAVTAACLLGLSSVLVAQTIAPPPPPPLPLPAVPSARSSDPESQQPTQRSGPASFSIGGVVVSATTGTPLDRADVSISAASEPGAPLAETITTENGGFRFDHLQAGHYRITTTRRGYITGGYQDHDGFTTGIVIGPNLNAQNLRVELLPTAVIDGIVTDDSGEPVPGAQVRLYRQEQGTGEERTVGAGTDITDDTGTYEFARLRAGTYFVSVSASPWYAFHPQPRMDDSGNLLPADQQPRSPLDVAYPTSWFENATDSDSASPLSVNAGDHVVADLPMHAVPAIHIQIRLRAPGENGGMAMPQLVQEAFGADQFLQPHQFTMATKDGAVVADLGGVAPGHYLLRQYAPQGEGPRTANVDLSSDQVVDLTTAATSGVEVSGKVAMIAGGKIPNRTRISLVRDDGGPNRDNAVVDPDGTFTLHSVAPGRYELQVESPGSRLAVMQMLASGGEAQGDHVVVASEPVLLAATLGSGESTITGFAKQGGKAIGGAMILLVPRDPGASHDLYRRDQSNTDGSFTLNRVVPGNYTLVAIENGWTLDWARPEVIAPYLARGVSVRVTGEKKVELPNPVEVEPR